MKAKSKSTKSAKRERQALLARAIAEQKPPSRNVAEQRQVLENVESILSRIAYAALCIRDLSIAADEGRTGASVEGMRALAEKTGYLADAATNLLKGKPASAGGGMCGHYTQWIGLDFLEDNGAMGIVGRGGRHG